MSLDAYEPSTGQIWLAVSWCVSLAGCMILASRFGVSGPLGQLVARADDLTIAVVGVTLFLSAAVAFVAGLFRYVYDSHPNAEWLNAEGGA